MMARCAESQIGLDVDFTHLLVGNRLLLRDFVSYWITRRGIVLRVDACGHCGLRVSIVGSTRSPVTQEAACDKILGEAGFISCMIVTYDQVAVDDGHG